MMMQLIGRFIRDEDGATAVEYALMVVLIAIVIIGSVTLVGTKLDGIFNYTQGKLVTPS